MSSSVSSTMEEWNIGIMGKNYCYFETGSRSIKPTIPSFHYSIVILTHHSIIPLFQRYPRSSSSSN